MQLFYEDCGTGQRREQGKDTTTVYCYYLQALTQFYLPGHGATTFTQINKEKTTLIDKGVRLDLLGLYGVGPGRPNESHETVQATFTLVVPRWASHDVPSPRQLA